ncbi:alpha/beta hydrolase [Stappia sp. BW2]|uniref:alpha/beta fold hydrolase n=1 Tax=Stappia sp. BW2 TaxID=2592622 RepID=UPI001AD91EE6|nr:alpha/beta hydrolase [Stappia sp. BW2]
MITFLIVLLAAAGLFFAYSLFRAGQISRTYEPDGHLAEVDGAQMHYHFVPASEAASEQPVLVFLHGASGNAYDMKLAFEGAFGGRYPLLFIDRPGLGFSQRSRTGQNTPESQARLITGLLEKLGIESAIVVGHSLGGAVTAAVGLAVPERVKGLVFLAPVSHVWPGGVNWYYTVAALPVIGWLFSRTLTIPVGERLVQQMLRHVFHPDPPVEGYADAVRVPLLFRPESFRSNAADICSLRQAVRQQSAHYGHLDQPTLIITGTKDAVVWPSIHCEGLLQDVPDAELLMLGAAGHMPQHTHTDEIVSGIDRLVARVVASGGKAKAVGTGAEPEPVPTA